MSLEKLASRAARPYTEIGRAVTGTPTADGAPTISDGDWQDMLGTSEEELVKHYRVKRTIPGSTLHVRAAVRTATGQGEELEVNLSTPQGEDCDYGNAFAQLSAGQLISAGAAAGNQDTFGDVEEASPCASSDTVLAKVDNGAMEVEGPRALEVRVVGEPPVEDPASLPENAVDSASYVAPPAGSSTAATTGGSSFADAPMLEPGVYRDTLVPGEVLTYAVDLEWGQALSAVVEFPQAEGKLGDAIGLQDMLARVDIVGPTRRDAGNAGFSGGPTNQTFISSYGEQAGAWAGPVAYKNRAEAVGAGSSLAGRYTVSLFLEEDPDRESYLIPITLRLGVEGEATAGPTYTEPAPSASPAPSDGPGSDAPADDSAEETTDSAATPENDGPGLGLVLGGMGVLALLSAAYLVMRSR